MQIKQKFIKNSQKYFVKSSIQDRYRDVIASLKRYTKTTITNDVMHVIVHKMNAWIHYKKDMCTECVQQILIKFLLLQIICKLTTIVVLLSHKIEEKHIIKTAKVRIRKLLL